MEGAARALAIGVSEAGEEFVRLVRVIALHESIVMRIFGEHDAYDAVGVDVPDHDVCVVIERELRAKMTCVRGEARVLGANAGARSDAIGECLRVSGVELFPGRSRSRR